MYVNFQIGDADHFDVARFPELQKSLVRITALLSGEPDGPVADMLLSFVKDHSINSQLIVDHPRLATLISTKELPLEVMENLFEASRKNFSFRGELETCIRSGLTGFDTAKQL